VRSVPCEPSPDVRPFPTVKLPDLPERPYSPATLDDGERYLIGRRRPDRSVLSWRVPAGRSRRLGPRHELRTSDLCSMLQPCCGGALPHLPGGPLRAAPARAVRLADPRPRGADRPAVRRTRPAARLRLSSGPPHPRLLGTHSLRPPQVLNGPP